MAEKKFRGAPFGIQTARFDVSGVHPKNKRPGTFTQIAYDRKAMEDSNRRLGPGAYSVDVEGFSEKAVMERASGPGWARAHELARMAALPHLLHKEQWELKKYLQTHLGPGSYYIDDFLAAAEQKPRSTRGICQTREPRFRETGRVNDLPGPGTYGIDGIPHKALEEKQKKSVSTIGMLDAGGASNRSLPMVGSALGPGCYNFSSFTEKLAKRNVSQRGPYDLFTGERNKPITTGHHAVPDQNLGPGQYNLPSCMDELNSEHKRKHGKFGTVAQYPKKGGGRLYVSELSQMPRDPDDPSPGHYDPKSSADLHHQVKKLPGFLSSSQRNDRMAQKFFTRNFNPVGAGRYDIQRWEESRNINSHTSVFKSRTNRPNHVQQKFLKERIRAKDVRPEDKIYIVEPDQRGGVTNKVQAAATKFIAQTAATVY